MATVNWDIPASDDWEEWYALFEHCRTFVQVVRTLEERIITGEITKNQAARTLRDAVELWLKSQGHC